MIDVVIHDLLIKCCYCSFCVVVGVVVVFVVVVVAVVFGVNLCDGMQPPTNLSLQYMTNN